MPFPAMRRAIVSEPTGVCLPSLPNRVARLRTKSLKTRIVTPRIVIPALGHSVGDHPDRKLCPVRALKAYLDRTKEPEVRRGRTRLFLNPKKPDSDISPAHISTWIKKLVQDAHEHAGVEHLRLAKGSAQGVRQCVGPSFLHLGQCLTVHHLTRLCKQRTGKARLPLPASISKQWGLKPKGCLLWAALWPPKQSYSPKALLRMRRRVFTLLFLSFLSGIESTDSCHLSMKRGWCFCWVFVLTLSASTVFPAEQ